MKTSEVPKSQFVEEIEMLLRECESILHDCVLGTLNFDHGSEEQWSHFF